MQYLASIRLRRELPAESYLRCLPPVQYLMAGNSLDFDTPVTFLIGENGTGKSTLLEAIAVVCGFNPEGGSRNFSCSTRHDITVARCRIPPSKISGKDGRNTKTRTGSCKASTSWQKKKSPQSRKP